MSTQTSATRSADVISVAEAAEYLVSPSSVRFIDCRFSLADPEAGERAYRQAHIPGAVYAHLDRDLSAPIGPATGRHPLPTPTAFGRTLARWALGAVERIVVYDDAGGAFAARCWWMLQQSGYAGVAVLDGGWQAWLALSAPVESGSAETETLTVDSATPVIGGGGFDALGADDLERLLASDAVLLVDARTAERYAGEVEPIDPVAGHVPGAVNRPFQSNLGPDGRLLAPQVLREQFEALLAGRAPGTVVHMCGSGVTACHNLLAMERAGLCGSRLYAGSWSEWIRDPRRAVARGARPG